MAVNPIKCRLLVLEGMRQEQATSEALAAQIARAKTLVQEARQQIINKQSLIDMASKPPAE